MQAVFDKMNIAQQDQLINADPLLAQEMLMLRQEKQRSEAQKAQAQQEAQQRQQAERVQATNTTIQGAIYGMLGGWAKHAETLGFNPREAKGIAAEAFEAFDMDTYKPGTKAAQLWQQQLDALQEGDKATYTRIKAEYEREAYRAFSKVLRENVKPGVVRSKLKAKTAPPATNPKAQFTPPAQSNGRPLTAQEHLDMVFAAHNLPRG